MIVRHAGLTLYLLALAVWVGGGALYTFVLTPAIFAGYGRNQAGEIVGALMPHYFRLTLLGALTALALLLALWRIWAPQVRGLSAGLALAAVLAQGYVNFSLHPRILAVKAQVPTFEADPDSAARRTFRALHGRSMALNLLILLDGASLLAIAPFLRR